LTFRVLQSSYRSLIDLVSLEPAGFVGLCYFRVHDLRLVFVRVLCSLPRGKPLADHFSYLMRGRWLTVLFYVNEKVSP
jgi:hypothetical protein